MSATAFSTLDRRSQAWLVAVAVLPAVLFGAARLLGVMSLAKLAVMGLAGMLALAVVFARPRWGVYFMAFYVYAGLAFYLPGVVSMAVMAVIAVVAAIEVFAAPRERFDDPLFVTCVGLFVLLSLHSTMAAWYPELVVGQMVKFFKALALALLIVHFTRSLANLRRLLAAVVLGAVATIVLGLINLQLGLYTEENVIRDVGVFRFSGMHPDPNEAAALMCSAIPLAVFFVREGSRRWMRWAALAASLVLVVGVFSTFSRSAIVAFAFVAVAVAGREIRSRRGYLAIVVFLVVAILVTPAYYWARLGDMIRIASSNIYQDHSLALRYQALTTAWHLSLENPWTGIGLGNFVQRGAVGVISRIVAHNAYLEMLVSTGVFGLLAFLGIFASGARYCRDAFANRSLPSGVRSLGYYSAVALGSVMVSALFLSMHFTYPMWVPLAVTLALGNVLRNEFAQAGNSGAPRA